MWKKKGEKAISSHQSRESNKKEREMTEEFSQEVNHIGKDTTIRGDIDTKGNLRIDGTFEGKIKCAGKLVVGETGVLSGEVECQSADISGQVNVTIRVSNLLELRKSSKFTGDIIAKQISVEPGCQISNTKVNFISEASQTSSLFTKSQETQSHTILE